MIPHNGGTRDTVISLFDLTGIMVQPWLDAGYEAWIVDVQHPVAYRHHGAQSMIVLLAPLARVSLRGFN